MGGSAGTSPFVTPKVFRTRLKSRSWQDCWQRDFKKVTPIKTYGWQLKRAGQLPSSCVCSLSVGFIDTEIYIYKTIQAHLIFPVPTRRSLCEGDVFILQSW